MGTAGNLTYDGQFAYLYDAWGRLVQVHEATWNCTTESVIYGPVLRSYLFDGLGRMVQSTRPTSGSPLITRHLYDGVRRIQDHLDDGGGFTLESEYVWGFGGAVDELIAHYDASGEPFYAIHDLSGDLVALCDLNGSAGAARVLAQWTYDAYGSVLTAEYPVLGAQPPPLRIGHKGLFFDRLSGNEADPQLWPHKPVVYHVRNRTYKPDLGRWLQRDPNSTARHLIPYGMAYAGAPLGAAVDPFSLIAYLGDGINTYQYAMSQPATTGDPYGLFGLVGGLATGYNLGEMSMDMMDTGYAGVGMGMTLAAMTDDYGMNQLLDVEWALDWSQDDHAYSRAGVAPALALLLFARKPHQWHHVLTRDGDFGRQNRELLARIGLDIEGDYSKVYIPHRGPHAVEYNREMTGRLRGIVENRDWSLTERRAKAVAFMEDSKSFLRRNPSFPQNTFTVPGDSTRHRTGWKGSRRKYIP